ncbi:UNVERIFIED_CONTAM: Sorbin and SH3 domain-containing protein 2 [Siphonaria sp. JEL0065]|nr:Sorbin and SH3 domain-containing protein 2 [Siphonaria sp. JEL0065]
MDDNVSCSSTKKKGDRSSFKGSVTQNEIHEAVCDWVPTASDELSIEKGDKIVLKLEYNDGWGFGVNRRIGAEGVFPLSVLKQFAANNNQVSTTNSFSIYSKRGSSAYEHNRSLVQKYDSFISVQDNTSALQMKGRAVNATKTVTFKFVPSREDELELRVNDKVKIEFEYDDYFTYADPANNKAFTDLASFDGYMQSWFDNSTAFTNQMANFYGCSGWNGTGLRYHISAYCGVWAYIGSQHCQASGTNVTVPPSPVCTSTVTNFISSWGSVMGNASLCTVSPAPAISSNRVQYVSLFNQLNMLNDAGCTLAVDVDVASFCGFPTKSEGQQYCQTTYDVCCTQNGLTQVVPSPTPTASPTPAPTQNTASIPVLPIAIGGGSVLVLLIVAMVCICMRKRQKAAVDSKESPAYEMQYPANSKYQQMPQQQEQQEDYYGQNQKAMERSGNKSRESYYKAIVPPSNVGYNNNAYNAPPPVVPMPNLNLAVAQSEKKYWVIINFKALQRDELSLIVGDVVNISQSYDDGWCFGTNSVTRSQGFFPIECISDSPGTKPSGIPKSHNNFNKRASSIYGSIQETPTVGKDGSYAVKFNYNPHMADELLLRVGDRALVFEEYDDGWAFGANALTRLEGLFPLDILVGYVSKKTGGILRKDRDSSRHSTLLKLKSGNINVANTGKAKSSAEKSFDVIYDFNPVNSDEIVLRVGDHVAIKQEYDDGWALGVNLISTEEGLFPLDCLSKATNASRQQRMSSIYGSQDDSNNNLYSLYTDNGKPAGVAVAPSAPVAKSLNERVLYDFAPERPDEIALKVGDEIIISQEYDDGWAFGINLRSKKEGSFPLDCLVSFNDSQPTTGAKKHKQRASSIFGVENGPKVNTNAPVKAADGSERVVLAFAPERSDELDLQIGDRVIVTAEYDDGWGYGTNVTTNQQGVFPLDCLESFAPQSASNKNAGKKARVSSIYDNPNSKYLDNTAPTVKNAPQSNVKGQEKVVYDFAPERDDEIELKVGQFVVINQSYDDGWAYGINLATNKEGNFPLDCLASFTDPAALSPTKKQRMSSIYGSEYDSTPAASTPKAVAKKSTVPADGFDDVVEPFTPERSDEIALRIGDRVNIQKDFDDGWCYGMNLVTGKTGYFPSDYLKSHNVQGGKSNGKKQRVSSIYDSDSLYGADVGETAAPVVESSEKTATVLYAFEPANSDEVTLSVGDRVVIQQEYDDGWMYGRNVSTGKEGVFPGDTLDVFTTNSSGNSKGDKQRQSSLYGASLPTNYGISSATSSKPVAAAPAKKSDEGRLVIYDFAPARDDELTLRVGDRVLVQHQFDDGWAYGLDLSSNKEGNFPIDCLLSESGADANTDKSLNPRRTSSIYGVENINNKNNSNGAPLSEYGTDSVYFDESNAGTTTNHTAIYAYNPEREDEVQLYAGDKVAVVTQYDDGWGYIKNLSSAREGLCPLDCLDGFGGDVGNSGAAENKYSVRASSMYGGNSGSSYYGGNVNSFYSTADTNISSYYGKK